MNELKLGEDLESEETDNENEPCSESEWEDVNKFLHDELLYYKCRISKYNDDWKLPRFKIRHDSIIRVVEREEGKESWDPRHVRLFVFFNGLDIRVDKPENFSFTAASFVNDITERIVQSAKKIRRKPLARHIS